MESQFLAFVWCDFLESTGIRAQISIGGKSGMPKSAIAEQSGPTKHGISVETDGIDASRYISMSYAHAITVCSIICRRAICRILFETLESKIIESN